MPGNYEITFSGSNNGLQVGVNNGSLNTGDTYNIERSDVYNTEGGTVFSGNITATRDVNITHVNLIRPKAQSLYKSLFTSSESFTEIRNEVGLLVSVLGATEEQARKAQAQAIQFPQLKTALENCDKVLRDLIKLKSHFDWVGLQSQTAWERIGGTERKLADIRSKLSMYTNTLNVLNTQMIQSSQENVERMLKVFLNEIYSGKRESTSMSMISRSSMTDGEKEGWRHLRKDLQRVGITPEIFSLNRDFILTMLQSLSQIETSVDFNSTQFENGVTANSSHVLQFSDISVNMSSCEDEIKPTQGPTYPPIPLRLHDKALGVSLQSQRIPLNPARAKQTVEAFYPFREVFPFWYENEDSIVPFRYRKNAQCSSDSPIGYLEQGDHHLQYFYSLLSAEALEPTPQHGSARVQFYFAISWYRRVFLRQCSLLPKLQRSRLWIQRLMLLYPIDKSSFELFLECPGLCYKLIIPGYYVEVMKQNKIKLRAESVRDGLWTQRITPLIIITKRLMRLTDDAYAGKPGPAKIQGLLTKELSEFRVDEFLLHEGKQLGVR